MKKLAITLAMAIFFLTGTGNCLAVERTHTIKAGHAFMGNMPGTELGTVIKMTPGENNSCVVEYSITTNKGVARGNETLTAGTSMNLRGYNNHNFLIRLNCTKDRELEVALQ